MHKAIGDFFKKWGVTHADGVSDVPRVAKIMELGKCACIILSDSDTEGRRGKPTRSSPNPS